MSPLSAGTEERKSLRGKVMQTIWMRDLDATQDETLITQDESDSESLSELFQEDVQEGWTNVALKHEVPQENHVQKAKEVHDSSYTAHINVIRGKLQEKAKESATQATRASEAYATAGLKYVAERLGYYANGKMTRDLIERVQPRSALLVGLKTSFFQDRNKAAQDHWLRNSTRKGDKRARSYVHLPNIRIKHLHDAAKGKNPDHVVLDKMTNLEGNNESDGPMKDVPLMADEDREWEEE